MTATEAINTLLAVAPGNHYEVNERTYKTINGIQHSVFIVMVIDGVSVGYSKSDMSEAVSACIRDLRGAR